jgi:hypothetical protein
MMHLFRRKMLSSFIKLTSNTDLILVSIYITVTI